MNIQKAVVGPFAFLVGFPILATEDALRYFGVEISEHGLTKNEDGKGIFQILNEEGAKIEKREREKKEAAALAERLKKQAEAAKQRQIVVPF